MTQEQPSAARAREEQIADITALCMEAGFQTRMRAECEAEAHVLDAEARGAAEERRRADALAAENARLREALGVIAKNKTADCPDGALPYLERLAWAVEWCRRTARVALASAPAQGDEG